MPMKPEQAARKIFEQTRLRGALIDLVRHGSLSKGGPQRWYAGEKNVCSTSTIRDLTSSGLAVAPGAVAIPTAFGSAVYEAMKGMVAHCCHARDCTREIEPEKLMCFMHWRRVSHANQKAVWSAYRTGQCDGSRSPSAAWHRAADIAINEVARKEGLPEKELDEGFYKHLEEGERGG